MSIEKITKLVLNMDEVENVLPSVTVEFAQNREGTEHSLVVTAVNYPDAETLGEQLELIGKAVIRQVEDASRPNVAHRRKRFAPRPMGAQRS